MWGSSQWRCISTCCCSAWRVSLYRPKVTNQPSSSLSATPQCGLVWLLISFLSLGSYYLPVITTQICIISLTICWQQFRADEKPNSWLCRFAPLCSAIERFRQELCQNRQFIPRPACNQRWPGSKAWLVYATVNDALQPMLPVLQPAACSPLFPLF